MVDLPAKSLVFHVLFGLELLLGELEDLLLLGPHLVLQILPANLQLPLILLGLIQHLLGPDAVPPGSFALGVDGFQLGLKPVGLGVAILKHQ